MTGAGSLSPSLQSVTENRSAILLSGRCGGSPQKRSAETKGSAAGTTSPSKQPRQGLGGQMSVSFKKPHQNGIGVREIRELPLKLVGPFRAMEEVVTEPPNNH